jgi:hypothetical protein
MKKIIIAFDGTNFSEGAFKFALELHKMSPVMVTGVFIPDVYFANLWSYSVGVPGGMIIPFMDDEDTKEVKTNIEHFEKLCKENNMSFATHKDFTGFTIDDLVKESRFADLLIIGSETYYKNMGVDMNEYLRDTLKRSECPVVIVPEKYNFPTSNILAYDGSRSSVFAIKQFAYVFPELANNPSLLIYLSEGDEEMPEKLKIEELTKQHFKNISFLHLQFDRKRYFESWLTEKMGPMLIAGSFGRSAFSRSFKKSFISTVVKDHQLPVFITHEG